MTEAPASASAMRDEHWRELVEAVPTALVVIDAAGRVMMTNEGLERTFGYARAELLGQLVEMLLPERFRGKHAELRGGYAAAPQPRRMGAGWELAGRRKDGSEFAAEISLSPIGGADSGISLAAIVDISQHKRAEAALRRSEERFRRIFEQSPLGICLATVDKLRILAINPAYCRMLGYAPGELVGREDDDIAHPDYRGLPPRAPLLNSEQWTSADKKYLTKSGGEVFGRTHVTRLPSTGDEPDLFLALVEDVTERRQAEEALRRSQKLFRTVFHASPNMISLTTLGEGRYVDVNDSFLRVLGLERGAVIGRTSLELGFWDDPSFRDDMMERLRRNGAIRDLEAKVRTGSGAIRDFLYSVEPIQFEERELLLGIGHDITDLRAAEAQLRQAQKLEAIGHLTGGVAHDFNNLLAIIQGNLELMDESIGGDPAMRPLLRDARRAAARGASLTHRLLAYSRQQPLTPRVVRIGELVLELTELLRRALGELVQIQTDIALDLWPAKIDPNQLENALLNLGLNARDAMPGGGRLIIEASNVVLDAEYAAGNDEVTAGPYVLVAMTDTGSGIDKAIIDRVLEPFFTTKPMGQGSGLGLSMVYGFVKQSGGHLKIYSEPGTGTTVKLYLPRAASGAEEAVFPEEAAAAALRSAGGELILVVEDDVMVRSLAVRILQGLGYRTLEAADGTAALAALETVGRVDLLLTDVVLPHGMSGSQLATQAQRHRPGLKVLYLSGYTRNAIIHNGVLDEGVHLLTKPFLKQELALEVRQRLDDRGEP